MYSIIYIVFDVVNVIIASLYGILIYMLSFYMLQQDNETPLLVALLHGHKDVVHSIIKEAKVDTTQLDQVIILPLPLTKYLSHIIMIITCN